MKSISQFASLVLLFLFSGCGAYLNQPIGQQPARIGEETVITSSLRQLPAPKDKLVAAVYKFRDQTGQYKPSENGASWSTAVTQGGTNILIRALEDCGWFIPIERENIGNLFNERKIISSSRKQYAGGGNPEPLPPLLFAGIILEGGVVSYDANILTGGAGLRYFGAGGSTQYRQDRVTVYLRAISTSTGKILKTVYTSKTILSQAVDVGLFRYVSFKRLLEAETGFTYNEPSEMAVTEAIEKAVQSLVIEGIIDRLWEADPTKLLQNQIAIDSYKEEKAKMQRTDILQREHQQFNSKGSFELAGMALLYQGDYPNAKYQPGIVGSLAYHFNPFIQTRLRVGRSQFSTDRFYEEGITFASLEAGLRLLPHDRLSPILYLGGGLLMDENNANSETNIALNAGLSMQYRFGKIWGLELGINNQYLLNDTVDEVKQGKYNDYFWYGSLGIKVFFGN
ncbi:MAG: hypothetical protein DHS20C18_47730 [Saprospiraceae bacterium]|nr:MAG: hypothetical protein DHS20C18_47730 [Saprospiraceae bacterium]